MQTGIVAVHFMDQYTITYSHMQAQIFGHTITISPEIQSLLIDGADDVKLSVANRKHMQTIK